MTEYNCQSSPVQSSPVQSSPVRDSVSKSHNRKVLIVTLIAPIGNCGNILQHYALQEAIKSLGYDAESLACPIIELKFRHRVKGFVVRNLKRAVKLVLALAGIKKYRQKLKAKLKNHSQMEENAKNDLKCKAIFQEFYREYFDKIIHSTYLETFTCNKDRWNEYDYIITGSDQVWNMEIIYTLEALRYYYLEFADQSKRVNYAPSFGVSTLKFYERYEHRKGLNGFNRLSCREEDGCDLIHSLTGREAQLVLDPTFLLTAEQWRKIARKPKYEVPEHYAFTYYLGAPQILAVKKLAEGLPIVSALNRTEQTYAMTGPREFLWLIDHADIVITASFHGTVFSVIFGKRFITVKGSWFGRLKTLLSHFDLTDRIYELDGDESNINVLGAPIDYDSVNMKLQTLREKSMKYLASCLGK